MPETAAAVQSGEPFAHYPHGRASDAELDQFAAFMVRVTSRPQKVARSLLTWAEEVVACRSENGKLTGLHGFRFMDVRDGRGNFRLIYAVFSLCDSPQLKAKQAGQVGVRVYGRERKEHGDAAIVWVNAPGCDPDLSFATGALRPVRRLVPGTHSRLPQNMRFYTDEAGETDTAPVPGLVDDAAANLLREQREREGDASMGRNVLRPAWTRLVAGVGVAAAAAAALLLLPKHQTAEAPIITSNREKGDPTLRVFRQKDTGGGEELISGSPVSPGDRVKFAVDLPDTQRIRVIGVESDGDLYQAWPLPGTKPADVVTAGRGWVLDGATVLDESRGRETLYLVSCPQSIDLPVCASQGPGQAPLCPTQCTLSPFVLDKTAHQ